MGHDVMERLRHSSLRSKIHQLDISSMIPPLPSFMLCLQFTLLCFVLFEDFLFLSGDFDKMRHSK